MKGYVFPVVAGLFVWAFATMFFILFGDKVLYSPGTENYVISIFFLLVGTGFLLWGTTHLYLFFDKSNNASLRFGIVGTIVGLALDTFSLSNHRLFFPKLDPAQIIAFTAWMAFAYALYLFIPAIINKKRSSFEK
ncbi:DUF5367 family protein [Lysinibacillus sp. KU-BSD001]|uniref:DUF5367 family protein n=1 Tax=Lysinibacillus sp. KU-BSD001 TaxID=3141328 RepID=UPI0036E5CD17